MRVTAPNWTFRIDQGASFMLAITIRDGAGSMVDPAGYTAYMQVREYPGAPGLYLDLSTETGGITVDTVNRRFLIGASADETAGYAWRHGVYDVFIKSPDGTRLRILQGEAEVATAVTVLWACRTLTGLPSSWSCRCRVCRDRQALPARPDRKAAPARKARKVTSARRGRKARKAALPGRRVTPARQARRGRRGWADRPARKVTPGLPARRDRRGRLDPPGRKATSGRLG